MNTYKAEIEDLFVLREFLRIHYLPELCEEDFGEYEPEEWFFLENLFHFPRQDKGSTGSYLSNGIFDIDYVTKQGESSRFSIERRTGDGIHEVVIFSYSGNAITPQIGEYIDELDKKMIQDLYTSLSEKPYSQLITGLDILVLND